MPEIETRYFRARVRPEGSIGLFERKDFACEIEVTGSYHRMCELAIADIRRQGYETHYIVSHSRQRDCL